MKGVEKRWGGDGGRKRKKEETKRRKKKTRNHVRRINCKMRRTVRHPPPTTTVSFPFGDHFVLFFLVLSSFPPSLSKSDIPIKQPASPHPVPVPPCSSFLPLSAATCITNHYKPLQTYSNAILIPGARPTVHRRLISGVPILLFYFL